MSQKILIAICILLFVASSTFLFWRNKDEMDPSKNKNWWTLSFEDPKDQTSLDFTVKNYSDNTTFQYELVSERQTLVRDTFELRRGETKTITPIVEPIQQSRTLITITAGNEKKEIYR